MNKEALQQANSRIVEHTQLYSELAANPEFITWHKEVVEGTLDTLADTILGIDRSEPAWKERACDMIAAYQETNVVLKAVFFNKLSQNRQARKRLQELEQESSRT